MGWSSGTGLFVDILEILKEKVEDDSTRREIILAILTSFEDADWDNLDEALDVDPVYDQIFYEKYPYDDEDNE